MKNPEYPLLIAQGGPLNGQRWLIKDMLVIGRENMSEIAIPDRQVSRQHARLTNTGNGVLLEDLESKNGTYWNGQRIEKGTLLHEGDEVQIALAQKFIFVSSDATLPLDGIPFPVGAELRIKLDSAARRVWVLDNELEPPLSYSQFSLLQLLFMKPGEVVSREEIITAVWGSETEWISQQALDALIRRLRERIAQVDDTHEYLVTIRGHGLRLDNPRRN